MVCWETRSIPLNSFTLYVFVGMGAPELGPGKDMRAPRGRHQYTTGFRLNRQKWWGAYTFLQFSPDLVLPRGDRGWSKRGMGKRDSDGDAGSLAVDGEAVAGQGRANFVRIEQNSAAPVQAVRWDPAA